MLHWFLGVASQEVMLYGESLVIDCEEGFEVEGLGQQEITVTCQVGVLITIGHLYQSRGCVYGETVGGEKYGTSFVRDGFLRQKNKKLSGFQFLLLKTEKSLGQLLFI